MSSHIDIVDQEHNNNLAQGSGDDDQQSRRMEEICTDILRRGVIPVKDVKRIIIERDGNKMSFISKLDVFKSPDSESYVILGEAKGEELSSQPESSSAAANVPNEKKDQKVNETAIFDDCDIKFVMKKAEVSRSKALKALEANNGYVYAAILNLLLVLKEEDIKVDVDEPEFDPDDIELVMIRGGVSKSKAVKALMANNGDSFDALMNILLLIKEEVDDRDIESVMTLASVSRIKAVTAIRACDGDIASAILNLTS